MIEVEVAYAKPEQQFLVTLELPENVTAEQAIVASGLLSRCREIDLTINKVGIFATACGLDQPLRQGDRVEIYRPLAHDPKDARRQRASSHKKSKK